MSHIVVTGAVAGEPYRPSVGHRLEARDFVKDKRLFSLYIRALEGFYKVAENEDTSHFQLGGIHGLPYQRWNDAGPETGKKGYCHHKTHLFPTWHRPYCALYEQVVYAHAIDAAKKYTVDREEWIKAAITFRLPFWDWGLHKFPPKEFYDVDNAAKVEIVDYDGTTTSVQNPLLSYSFAAKHGPPDPTHSSAYLDEIAKLPSTLRHPTIPIGESSKTNVEDLESSLNTLFENTPHDVSRLLLTVKRWYPFSTSRKEPDPSLDDSEAATNSLEAIHDNLHGEIGGDYGHMSAIAYAAFDPIFWLHHVNVDRVLSLWQVIHYDSWIEPAKDGNETWVTKPGDLLDENTQLGPFWKDQERWWTSAQAKESAALWYTYPDFDNIDLRNRPEASQAISTRVEQLYGPPYVPAMPGANSKAIEWSARIRAVKGDLKDINSVLIFIGKPPTDEKDLLTSPNFIGLFHPFVNALTTLCSNCADTEDESVQGFVHMSSGLVARTVDIHNIGAVEVYLRNNLEWVIRKVGGGIGSATDIPSLEVTVIDTRITPPTDDETGPMISRPREHPTITEGRPGGHRGE